MRGRGFTRSGPLAALLAPGAALLALCAAHCGQSSITHDRVERAIGPTFANLVHLELGKLGVPAPPPASSLRVLPACHKVGAPGDAVGPGDWACTFSWTAPGARIAMHDTYGVSVRSDGCYTATAEGAEGEEAHLGGPTLVKKDGTKVTNLLYVFEGCFDVP